MIYKDLDIGMSSMKMNQDQLMTQPTDLDFPKHSRRPYYFRTGDPSTADDQCNTLWLNLVKAWARLKLEIEMLNYELIYDLPCLYV